ncbi:MAG TPA: GNAT family N-acetyltransferase [Opitutaceae bacterium]|jgi:L-amino acid N-acyltransferase YncA|nr:GNAT family N-acetyltransferase [Opitutaceae bacterium]
MTLRDATDADLPTIVEIYNSIVPGHMITADLEPVSIESRVPWFRAHNPRTRPIWVVDDPVNGRVIAWLSFSSFYGRPAYNPTAEISIYVAEMARRQGLGKYLLGEAIARAPACDVHTLLGFIFAHNDPSLQLFEKFGFARWGHLPRVAVLDTVERDLVIVGRRTAT